MYIFCGKHILSGRENVSLCWELMLKYVLAKPHNPLYDHKSRRFEGFEGFGNPLRSSCAHKM